MIWPIFLLESLIIVALNATTIATIALTSTLRKRRNVLLVSIAVADFCVGAVSVPIFTAILSGVHVPSNRNLWIAQDTFFAIASMFGLASLSVERMCVISWPLRLQNAKATPLYAVFIGLPWLLALISAVTHASLEKFNLADFYFSIVTVMISLLVILVANVVIWVRVSAAYRPAGNQRHELERKLAITASVVVMVSLVAWLPFVISNMIIVECRGCYDHDIMWPALRVTKMLHYGNSLVNPIVYVIKLRDFRKAALNLLACSRAAPPPDDVTLATIETAGLNIAGED